ncbi:HEPN domain-containing protein [Streptomyces sp. NPDC048560]|uniref:ApeA N-terminal domain 1-containing protein n=1 Tax=Streptomyces sp. NPDC048560 TaxID=3155488 RepID=UPI0034280E50
MPDKDPRRIIAEGDWWLPGSESKKVKGILTHSPEDGTTLRIHDSLAPDVSVHGIVLGNQGAHHARIFGAAGNHLFSLENCSRTERTSGHLNNSPETAAYNVGSFFRGVHWPNAMEPSAESISGDLRYLTHWVDRSGIRSTHNRFDPDLGYSAARPFASLDLVPQPKQSVPLDNGMTLLLYHNVKADAPSPTQSFLSEKYMARFASPSGVLPTSDLTDQISNLQDLVSIATGRTAEFDSLSFRPSGSHALGRPDIRTPIDFFARWLALDTSPTPHQLHPHQMHFTFDALGGIAGVRRWLNTADIHRPLLGRVMSSRYNPHLFVEDRFFHRVVALEALGRHLIKETDNPKKDPSLKWALNRCISTAGPHFLNLVGDDTETWAGNIVTLRNDISHHYGKRPDQVGAPQYYLAESLYWLFVLCLLQLSSAPDEVYQQIRRHRQWSWLRPRVAESLRTTP